jgi:hypothetical protein
MDNLRQVERTLWLPGAQTHAGARLREVGTATIPSVLPTTTSARSDRRPGRHARRRLRTTGAPPRRSRRARLADSLAI